MNRDELVGYLALGGCIGAVYALALLAMIFSGVPADREALSIFGY